MTWTDRVSTGPALTGPAPHVRRRLVFAPVQPGARTRRSVLFRPAVWITLLMLAAGAWRVGDVLRRSFESYPLAASGAVVLFALYAVPFVILLRMIDYLEREPLILQVTAFAWGGLVATSAAISGSTALQDILAKLASPMFAAEWGPAVVGAGLEEILKVLGVVLIALVARGRLNSLVDGFVYGALIGLGFQVVEDIVFAVNAVALDAGTDRLEPVVVTFLLRGFLGGLWSHTLFSALAGAGVAYVLVRRDRALLLRVGVAAALFSAAWGFHFLWNSPILDDGIGYGIAGLPAVLLIKGIPALIVAITLIVAAERREASYYAGILAALADPRIATPEEIAALVSPRRRVAARRRARLRLGRAGAAAVRRLQRAQAQLAVAVSRDPGAEVLRRRREVLARRHQLLALSIAVRGAVIGRTATVAAAAAVVAEVAVIALLIVGIGIAIRALGGS